MTTPPDQPEDAALLEAVTRLIQKHQQAVIADPDTWHGVATTVPAIMQLFREQQAKAVQAAREKAEYWQPFDALYDVSTLGRVRRNGKILRQSDRGNGYLTITISTNNTQKSILVHRMVASTFITNPYPQKPCVNHIDGDRTNNMVTNLEWVTHAENEQHAFKVLNKKSWNANTAKYETVACAYCGAPLTDEVWRKRKFCNKSHQMLYKYHGAETELQATQPPAADTTKQGEGE